MLDFSRWRFYVFLTLCDIIRVKKSAHCIEIDQNHG